MRHTALGYKNPQERTPDFRYPSVSNKGHNFFTQRKAEANDLGQRKERSNSRGNKFGLESRFNENKIYAPDSGVSPFIGPGTYKAQECFNNLNRRPTSAIFKQSAWLSKEESKNPAYILVGQ